MVEWDIPNWTTMIVEIIVAGFAVGISIFFYKREKKERTDSDKNIKKMEKLFDEQEKQKKNQLRLGLATIENELKNLNVSLDLLSEPEKHSQEYPAEVIDYGKATYRNELYNLNNCLMVFPLEQLPNEFTDKLLDLLSYSKAWIDDDVGIHSDIIINKTNELLNLTSKIKKDFSQQSN